MTAVADADSVTKSPVAISSTGVAENGGDLKAVTGGGSDAGGFAKTGRIVKVAVARADRSVLRAAAPLFPEFVPHRSPDLVVLVGRAVDPKQTARRSRLRPALAVTPGLLRMPDFGAPGTPWLSGTVAHAAQAGVIGPGWCESALGAAGPALRGRAEAAMAAVVRARVGGSFWAPALAGERPCVLLCVGATGDPGPTGNSDLVDRLLAGHAAADLVVLAGEGGSPAIAAQARRRGCTVLTTPVDPWSAIERARAIHLAGDHPIGLLALFAGRQVHCHGETWYGGRGAVDAAAAWLTGTRHVDPYSGCPATCEASIALLADWRERLIANRRIACCVGISGWKRRRIAAFFHTGDRPPLFRRSAAAAVAAASRAEVMPGGGAIAVWNSRIPAGLVDRAAAAGVAVVRVEDGFIRSAGLGSDFLPPCSVIADAAGIYYDPSRPSDLERLLAETIFPPALLARAGRLIGRLLADGVTKYGAGTKGFRLPAERIAGRRTILVPGQVADDLSIRLGAAEIRTNLALLQQVRAANPDAYVIYKPHPDVQAGHRLGAIHDADARRLADLVVAGVAMSALIEAVDEVHTMTSLAGFEALLRRRVVCVYGQPFYAGWGLTTDLTPVSRRKRSLTLEELAAGVLILYPRYLDPVTSLPCGPELLIERLARPEFWRPGWLMRVRQMQGRIRRCFRRISPVLVDPPVENEPVENEIASSR